MPRPFDFGRVELSVTPGQGRGAPKEEPPFSIAILSNFSGPRRSEKGPVDRKLIPVDRDNLDEVIAGFSPALTLVMDGGETLALRFRQLDDFHPDQLLESAEIFRRLREVRLRLQDPATFAAAAEELGLGASPARTALTSAATSSSDSVVSSVLQDRKGSLLEDIVEQAEERSEPHTSHRPDQLQEFVQRVTKPHLVRDADIRQTEVLRMIDQALSAQMRALLHVPAFQALEAAWRAVYFLVRRIETSELLKVYLVDISQEDLRADVMASPDLRESETYRLLVQETVDTPGANRLALLVGDYTYDGGRDAAAVLARMAKIAQAAGAPFLAAASPRLLGCTSIAETPHPREWKTPLDGDAITAWETLRRMPEASCVGLALPRFLLRLPYGKDTDLIESFDFEEMPGEPQHEDYLWGNPAFACGVLLAQSFSDDGWAMRPGTHSEIDGLPLHVYKSNGESTQKPCAEGLLTEEAVARILERGLMPLVSIKGADAVRVVGFESIRTSGLQGRWNS